MAIPTSEIKFRLSGGAGNSNPAASLGGAMSTTEVNGATLFDTVDATEATSGDTEYRCVYVLNTNASEIARALRAWYSANTPNALTTLNIGKGSSAISGTEQTVANENTSPTGVSFVPATSEGAGVTVGDIAPTGWQALWLQRVISAGATSSADTATMRVAYES